MEQPATEVIPSEMPRGASLPDTLGLVLQQLRIKQWTKNLIVFVPILFSGKFTHLDSILAASLCFVTFCISSSAIYILNDILDVKRDRAHPIKKNRPIASGRLSIKLAIGIALVLLAAGCLLAFHVRPSLMIVVCGYVLLNLMYSTWLKNVAILDVFCISSGFVFRVIAGAAAVSVMPSTWLLLCTTLGAIYLALEKRRQEILLLAADSSQHRQALSDYSLSLLMRMEGVIVPSLVTCYAIYTFNSPHGNWLMVTIPVVLYGVMRYQLLSEKGTSTGTPEEVLLKDRPIQLTLILWVLLCAIVIYGHPGDTVRAITKYVDGLHAH